MAGMASFGGGGTVAPSTASIIQNLGATSPAAPSTAQIVQANTNPQAAAVVNDYATNSPAAIYDRYNKQTYSDLLAAGYTGKYVSQKNWGAYGSLGGIGEQEANKQYQQLLAQGKSSGDWSGMDQFMQGAEAGDRKYHRNGLFGLGIDLMPHSLGGALLAAGGAAAGLGVFSGFGIPGLVPGSGVTGSANSLASGSGGLSASGNAFSGISGFNAASPYAQALSSGSSLGSLAGLGPTGNLVGNAAIGLGTNAAPSSLWGNLSKLSKAGNLAGGGQQQEQGQQGYGNYMGLSPSITNINTGIPDFHYGNYDSSNVVSNGLQGSLGNAQRQPFMSVIDKFNARYK